jgi:hypothetical protein
MLAQLVTKLKRAESSRAELITSRASSRATSILSSPKRRCLFSSSVTSPGSSSPSLSPTTTPGLLRGPGRCRLHQGPQVFLGPLAGDEHHQVRLPLSLPFLHHGIEHPNLTIRIRI